MAVTQQEAVSAGRSFHHQLVLGVVALMLIVYLALAYVVLPFGWRQYVHMHPAIDADPRVTETSDGHPGDPLNVLLIGTKAEIKQLMRAAGWEPAAALGIRSDLEIAADTILKHSDNEAPVSNLYLFGRKEDLAFEQPAGGNPRQRHHVRLWENPTPDEEGRPMWIGAASYDDRVGFSHTTGQITHHIAPDVDKERDHLFDDLQETGLLADIYEITDFHTKLSGRNGGGDLWETDGALRVGICQDEGTTTVAEPAVSSPSS